MTHIARFPRLLIFTAVIAACTPTFTISEKYYTPSVDEYYKDRYIDYGENYEYTHPEAPSPLTSPYQTRPAPNNNDQYSDFDDNYYPIYPYQEGELNSPTGDGVYQGFATDNVIPYEYDNKIDPVDNDADYYPLYYNMMGG